MNILSIEVDRSHIRFLLDEDGGQIALFEHVATISSKMGRKLSDYTLPVKNNAVTLPRFDGEHDRLFSRWAAYRGAKQLGGVCYATKILPEVPQNDAPYPQPSTINCICRPWRPWARTELGALQTQFDVNLPQLMTVHPQPEDIVYRFDGEDFYFQRKNIEELDQFLLSEPEVTHTAVMVSAFGRNKPVSQCDREEIEAFYHPDFDWDCPSAYISAFDVQTENGLRHFAAFIDFLTARYSRPDKKYGQIAGYVVSNEVTSQYVWGNAGEKTVEEYCEEYLHAMRVTWLAAASHWSAIRVYASFDHFWHAATFDATQPKRFYPGRKMLDLFLEYSLRDGNFPWHLAHHPYPENLNFPDFWNDRYAKFTFETPKVTYKNMEVLEAYLGQEKFLYEGEPRRIIFPEQSLNSQNGPFAAITEQQAAAGYILSYLKARNMKTVDMFMHRLLDDPGEFGLNLGIYRFDSEKPDCFGEPKPICACVKAVDTPEEEKYVKWAREYIGPDMFDLLLNPPPIEGVNEAKKFDIVTH